MRQSIIDFLSGLSGSIIHGFSEHSGIGRSIEEGLERSKKILFSTIVAISLAVTGIFLFIWGIASAIDSVFDMRGLGLILIGLFGLLTGALLIYKK